MAYSQSLADRMRDVLASRKNVDEKKMFGCLCFFLNGNALVGVWKDSLIARLGPKGDDALQELNVRTFDITGKPMRNWVVIDPEGVENDTQLSAWIDRASDFVQTLPRK